MTPNPHNSRTPVAKSVIDTSKHQNNEEYHEGRKEGHRAVKAESIETTVRREDNMLDKSEELGEALLLLLQSLTSDLQHDLQHEMREDIQAQLHYIEGATSQSEKYLVAVADRLAADLVETKRRMDADLRQTHQAFREAMSISSENNVSPRPGYLSF
ncbi:hypothetical protein BKA67DRAFT_537212 [Truncatella angustata]|uniref:Uncharacterized protein n=1 Tax=Truncatella angustata TaxID=152316 RepID=A0A9P8UJY7_9PEZI|nr:uncharacterized protein BKA67DRAFT_537212 [Truncatella angustata]KAH6653561.1 hypothetical protein BKA67DRAFT_537212 [Truncatella angustata]